MFRVLSVVLIFSILSSGFTRWMITAGFELNQEYIAKELCENKARPAMQCKGKCYLAKKVKQAEEKEKGEERGSQKNRFQEAFFADNTRLQFGLQLIGLINTAAGSLSISKYPAVVFHPPQASLILLKFFITAY